MKKFIFPVLLCSLLNLSCSADDTPIDDTAALATREGFVMKNGSSPANPSNQYDVVGRLHAEILNDYLQNYNSTAPLQNVVANVDAIADNNTGFAMINGGYTGLDINDVEWTIDNVATPSTIINAVPLTSKGKQQMNDFLALVDTFENKPFSSVYTQITAFEDTIIRSSALTASDKQIILSTTSTSRYAIADCIDNDRIWGKTKVGIISSVNEINAAKAVTMSITASIAAN